MAAGPTGLLVIHPEGRTMDLPPLMAKEVATNVFCALLAAIVLTQVRSGYLGRVLCVTLMGVFAFAVVCVPYWNWYGFPLDFTIGQAAVHIVGWLLAGLVLAAIVRPVKEKSTPLAL